MRHLEIAKPQLQPATLVLMENDGTEVISYQFERSFRRIERHGRWFRLNGRDRDTGEMIYLPEVDIRKAALQALVDQAEEQGLYDAEMS